MARFGSVWRICCGGLLLFCVLSTVEASTLVPLNMPSAAVAAESASSYAIVDGALEAYVSPLSGDYIQASPKNVPVRGILGGTTFGLNTITTGAKNLLKGTLKLGIQSILVDAAMQSLLDGVQWVMTDGALAKKTAGLPAVYVPAAGQSYWQYTGSPHMSSASEACDYFGNALASPYGKVPNSTVTVTGDSAFCKVTTDTWVGGSTNISHFGGSCPAPSTYSATAGACVGPATLTPVTYANIDSPAIDAFVAAQNAAWVNGMLKNLCNSPGSINPTDCYNSYKRSAVPLKGPATVTGDATTTTTTVANPDGTTSTVVTNNVTKYNIVYGSNNFTYDKNTNTTVTTDGKLTSTTTTTPDPANPTTTQDPAPAPDPPTAAPCSGSNCSGPAYTKLYEPTQDTKEKFIDSFSSRITQAPIISAASGFFHITAGSGCPVWSAHPSFSVYQASFDAELVFDFHCQPWFVSMAQYAKIVMSIVCAYLAFRQAFLD